VGITAAVTSFLVVLPAEMPDKTVLACLVLSSRYRPLFVYAGASVALATQVVLAVAAGTALTLLPHRAVAVVAAVSFVAGAVLLMRHQRKAVDEKIRPADAQQRFVPVAATSFAIVFLAEFGDLTQIMTISLAARFHDPLSVGIGAVLALWVAAGIAVVVGWRLLKYVPVSWLTWGAALIMLSLAGTSIASALA
jgi:putative Ca2+/H+ antiporter (TMEM165/GDT1 family)